MTYPWRIPWFFNQGVQILNAIVPQGPHSHILMTGGGVRQRFIFYTPKNPNFRICLPKKISTFFSIPKKIPQCFCIRKFYYLSSEISESATHLCMGLYYYVFLAFIFT